MRGLSPDLKPATRGRFNTGHARSKTGVLLPCRRWFGKGADLCGPRNQSVPDCSPDAATGDSAAAPPVPSTCSGRRVVYRVKAEKAVPARFTPQQEASAHNRSASTKSNPVPHPKVLHETSPDPFWNAPFRIFLVLVPSPSPGG
jgi:hypothetical protein